MPLNTVKAPSLEQLREVAAELGFSFPESELSAHREALLPAFEGYGHLDRIPDELPPVTYPRLPGRRPAPEENRHGAWYVKTEIEGFRGPAQRQTDRAEKTISASPARR